MRGIDWALLLKPMMGLALIAAYYFVIVKGLRWLHRKLPDSKITRFLFKERGKSSYWSVVDQGGGGRSGSGRYLK